MIAQDETSSEGLIVLLTGIACGAISGGLITWMLMVTS